jgi:Tfp pilus assembly protein PilX
MQKYNKHFSQSGAVSLFVVIFAALLITVVTLSFVQLMVKDQQQATASDLSQSAYDSAQAGVEDAKRLLLLDQSCRSGGAPAGVNCGAIANALTPPAGQPETACNTLAQAGIVGETNNETIIQQSVGDNADKLDQAYTCVKIKVNTDDYKGDMAVNESDIVPITGVGTFDTVELKWFSRADISSTTNNPAIGFHTPAVELPPVGSKWQFNYPPLMRTQLMQLGSSFKLAEFDDQASGKSNANTLFLYPSRTGIETMEFTVDARRSPINAPHQATCVATFDQDEYACKTLLRLPAPIDGSTNRNAYLRLSALYNGAHYSIKLKNGTSDVKFDRVQPEVDSTGRANDLFRRVKARVELKGDFTYPEAAVDLTGSLCKNFTVTDQEDGYRNPTSCTP